MAPTNPDPRTLTADKAVSDFPDVSALLQERLTVSLIADGFTLEEAAKVSAELVEFAEERCREAKAQRASVPPDGLTHRGNRANAEDCPACCAEQRNLDYPFVCPEKPGAPLATPTGQPR